MVIYANMSYKRHTCRCYSRLITSFCEIQKIKDS